MNPTKAEVEMTSRLILQSRQLKSKDAEISKLESDLEWRNARFKDAEIYVIALKKEIKILREALEDFRDFGTRHDINPTGMFKECGCFQSMSNDSWQGYIRSQDTMTRLRAKQFLSEADKIKGELG